MQNKAKKVREALGLTPTECGKLLLGCNAKQAYDTWTKWDKGIRNPSRATERLFDIILILKIAKNSKTPGAENALDIIINSLGIEK